MSLSLSLSHQGVFLLTMTNGIINVNYVNHINSVNTFSIIEIAPGGIEQVSEPVNGASKRSGHSSAEC